jgi:lysophospholipase L1-like esterase
VVDLMCDSRTYEPSRFSSDGFHPSDSGYALMADLAYPALAAGSAPSPSPSCSQRTLLPVF